MCNNLETKILWIMLHNNKNLECKYKSIVYDNTII